MRLENLDDGSKLEAAWHEALSSSLSYFRALLQSSNSSSWKAVQVLPLTSSTTAHDSATPLPSSSKKRKLGHVSASDVRVHRRSGKHGEVFRAVLDVDCGPEVGIEDFRGCLVTPETRPAWDRMVEEAMTEDMLDAHTRVTRTRFRLGWPSSPRDTITISKTLVDQRTLIDISTSLPRSRHEPGYLRPAPPYVRAQISLLAWCVQLPDSATEIPKGKCRVTCFWSWNPKGAWAVGGGVPQHLPSLMVGLVNQVNEESDRVPVLSHYGPEVAFSSVSYDPVRVTLNVGYAIVAEHAGEGHSPSRQVEFGISSSQSWDVQIYVKTQHGEESPSTAWTSFVGQSGSTSPGSRNARRLVLRFCHAALLRDEELVRVRVSIERTSSSAPGVRINGIPVTIEPMAAQIDKRPLLEETASTSGISLRTMSTMEPMSSRDVSSERKSTDRANAAQKGIASLVKRNYIYFTSLLQEPEPKWRPVLDSRGVAIHQLNSIDKTLVVFRAEAVFVGVGIWDLYATIASPGGRVIWDKTHDDANLLEDVNELTDLWHFKSKPAWPVSARDSVMLRTTYKSPSSVHLFGFSVDDNELFPNIPPIIDPTVIRTQIDLQGWSIESLSPNTTQVTLVEQSDPRGWSNKSSIPQVMMSTLAGIGEFSIKHGAPPITTRLGGAKALSSRYDVAKETFRYEYQSADARRSNSSSTATAFPLPVAVRNAEGPGSETASLQSLEARRLLSTIECEIRCDAEKWSNSCVLVIDPPHCSISALKRHRLSSAGGGLWLTIEHDPVALGDEKVVITIKRGASIPGSKTSITANGHKVKIDVEDMAESEAQLLLRQKRSRPTRLPLDQPPALGTLRKKQSTMELPNVERVASPPQTAYSRIAQPLGRWYSVAADSTRAALVPMTATPVQPASSVPVDAAVRALGQLARMHADRDGESTDPFGWQPVSERDGLKIEKRVVQHVSESFPVYRAGRIIEGFTAEEVSASVSSMKKDERFDKPQRLESYGHGVITSQVSAFTTFPFRSRNMLLATVVARAADGPPPSPSINPSTSLSTIFHASTSAFDPATTGFDAIKYNPTTLPDGHIVIEGWILETIDPYSHEQYAIPSTRCMYVVAADYSGNIPLSVNNLLNGSLPRSILSVEANLKAHGPPCRAQLPNMSVMMPDTSSAGPWALEGSDVDKAGVDERIERDDYALTVIVSPSVSSGDRRDGTLSPTLRHNESRTSVTSTRSTIIDLGEDIRRGRRDLVVCEVHIAQTMIQSGADISLRGIALPVAQNPPDSTHSDSIMSYTLPQQQLDLPFKVSIIALAPSVLQSASLDPSAPARHLLRVTLPTSEYEAPITDPLTGKSAPAPRPRWYLDLLNDGAVVQIKLKTRKNGPARYILGEDEVTVQDEKTVRGFVKDFRSKLPQLVSRDTPGSRGLAKPLAVARELMSSIPAKLTEAPEDDAATEPTGEAVSPEPDTKVEVSEIMPPPPLPPSSSRYSFWKYPYPRLGRFANSAPGSTLPSPAKPVLNLAPEEDRPDTTTPSPNPINTDTTTRTTASATSNPLLTPTGLIICCLLSLLIGSLFRSLLSEADFVIHLPAGGDHPAEGEWRELKRLAEWKIGWGRDLVIAIARR